MPLKIEIYSCKEYKWKAVSILIPKDRPGSISDVRGDTRQVYLFECINDDKSKIYLSRGGVDIADDKIRKVMTEGLKVVKELRINDSYVMQVKTDIGAEERKIRFTHF